jgi:hypothetical protein
LKGVFILNYNTVLKKIESGELDPEKAYDLLYTPSIKESGKRAFFLKMNIEVPDEGKGINTFLKILFMIPIPLIFARIVLRVFRRKIEDGLKDVDFEIDDIIDLIKYSKHTRIQVDSEDAKIDIKII